MVVTCCHGSRLYLSLLCALCSEDELLSVLPAVSLSINTQPQVTFLLLCQEFSFLIRDTLLNKKKKSDTATSPPHGSETVRSKWKILPFFFLLLWRFDQNSEPHNVMQLLRHQVQFNDQNPHRRQKLTECSAATTCYITQSLVSLFVVKFSSFYSKKCASWIRSKQLTWNF